MATGDEKVETAIGNINGVNQDFSTSIPYQSGTLFILWNGQLLAQDDDEGHDEVDPGLGTFRTRVPPIGGSKPAKLWVRYIEA